MLPVTLVLTIAIAMQFQSWPLTIRSMPPISTASMPPTRSIPYRGGRRAWLMPGAACGPWRSYRTSIYPRGRMVVTMWARSVTPAVSAQTPVARIVVFQLDGRQACESNLTARSSGDIRRGGVPCGLTADGPATLIIYSRAARDRDRPHHLNWMR